jgi:hypothetical protein
MRISPKLAHRLQNDLQEAMGALDLGLLSEDAAERSRRMLQAKAALRKASYLIGVHVDRSFGKDPLGKETDQ